MPIPPYETPPAIRTLPSLRSVAVCVSRAAVMLPVAANAPVDGSYSSAVAMLPANQQADPEQLSVSPPTASTTPLGSSVSVCHTRGAAMLPVDTNVRVDGL